MSLATRIIPCLDVKDGRVVKGINFLNLVDAGDPVEMAQIYNNEGADEITFLDITASSQGRGTTLEVVRRSADQLFIPLTVGGGISSAADVNQLLRAGADKVSINTAALKRPELINEISESFGSQVLVISIDAKRSRTSSGFEVTTHGGSISTGIDALDWIKEAIERGVGEILLNSMDTDGTRAGYDLELIRLVRSISPVPIVASGGAGDISDFASALGKRGKFWKFPRCCRNKI
ncbi:MAG: imidazole glycerol phosphate synthase subunit HisF [Actinobacteria bacterium]|nr:imidazole glycerol phosphate synthase subunit HisF [Actinomycetota bacterium]